MDFAMVMTQQVLALPSSQPAPNLVEQWLKINLPESLEVEAKAMTNPSHEAGEGIIEVNGRSYHLTVETLVFCHVGDQII